MSHIVRRTLFVSFLLSLLASTAIAATIKPAKPTLPRSLALTAVRFEPNRGQARGEFCFIGRGSAFRVGLSATGATLAGTGGSPIALSFVGANTAAPGAGEGPLVARSNYFRGDAAQWRSGIENYSRVRFRGVYPGIDVVYYGDGQGRLEHDLVAAPGADPERIRWRIDGARIELAPNGDVNLTGAAGSIVLSKVIAYQEAPSGRREIPVRYAVLGKTELGLRIGNYDRTLPLVIDPVLVFSRYIAGNSDDKATSVATDSAGNVFVVGTTLSTNFLLLNPLYTRIPAVFVMKFNPAGVLLFSTLLGDSLGARAAVDAAGDLYLVGASGSWPTTPGAYKTTTQDSGDFYVTKLSADGSRLIYSTLVGGTSVELDFLGGIMGGPDIAVDADGNAYVVGTTRSNDFPVLNGTPHPSNTGIAGGQYAFRLNATGTALDWSTYLFNEGFGVGVALDGNRNLIFGGSTPADADLVATPMTATPGAFQTTKAGSYDAYVGKLSPTGSLIYLTFLGGELADYVLGIAADAAGNAYVVGQSMSLAFPVKNAFQPSCHVTGFCDDVIVAEINPGGSGLVFSTYFGGTGASATTYGNDYGEAVRVDGNGNVWIAGYTNTFDFPMMNPVQGECAPDKTGACSFDTYVAEFSAAGSLMFSTYLGGSDADSATAIAVSRNTDVYVVGNTASTNFPTKGIASSYQNSISGIADAFVYKLSAGAARAEVVAAPTSYVFPSILTSTSAQVVITLGSSANQTVTVSNIAASSGEFNIINNSCTNIPMAPGATCTFTAQFTPALVGLRQATITVTSNADTPLTIPVSGTGLGRPLASISPTSLNFGAQEYGKTSAAQRVTLSNIGSSVMTISAITFTTDYASSATTCGSLLDAGSSCYIDVTFTPTWANTRPGSLSVATDSVGSPHTVALTGTGLTGIPSIVPGSLTFVQLLNTTSAPKSFQLTNIGTLVLPVTGVTASPNTFAITHNCPATLAVSASCTINVTYTPTTVQAVTGAVTVSWLGVNSPGVLPLYGSGTNPVPAITSLTPASLPAGHPASTLTINGTNFAPGATVWIDGVQRTDGAYVSSTQMTVSITAADALNVRSLAVTVKNSTPGGGTSNGVNLSITTNVFPEGALEAAIAADGGSTVPQYGGLTVSGWAADPDDGSPVSSVQVSITNASAMPNPGLYLFDGQRMRKVSPDGQIATYAGTGLAGYSGNNGPATLANIYTGSSIPWFSQIAYDAGGNIYFADTFNNVVRKIDAVTGVMTLVAGTGTAAYGAENVAPTASALRAPSGLAIDAAGNLYIGENGRRIRKVSAATQTIATIAGNTSYGFGGDNGPASSAQFNYLSSMVTDSSGNLFVVDYLNHRVRRIAADTGIITTVAGSALMSHSGDGGPATAAGFTAPTGIAIDRDGAVYVTDNTANVVRKFTVGGNITTVAGPGTASVLGDNGPATSAYLSKPVGIAIDTRGYIYIADSSNYRVRRIDPATNIITTVAGNGSYQFSGDDGPATSAGIAQLTQIAVVGGDPTYTRSALATLGGVRSDIAASKGKPSYTNSGWTQRVSVGSLPPGLYKVTARAVDQCQASANLPTAQPITIVAGSGPYVQLDNDALNFNTTTQVNGISAPTSLTVTNTGTAVLTISSIIASAEFVQANDCGTVAPNASCTIRIWFRPSTAGARSGTLTINHNAFETITTVALTGTGIDRGVALARPVRRLREGGPIALPPVAPRSEQPSGAETAIYAVPDPIPPTPTLTASVRKLAVTPGDDGKAVTITNTGRSSIRIAGIQVSAGFHETHTCGESLAENESCTVTIVADPALANRSGTLTVSTGSGSVSVALSVGEQTGTQESLR